MNDDSLVIIVIMIGMVCVYDDLICNEWVHLFVHQPLKLSAMLAEIVIVRSGNKTSKNDGNGGKGGGEEGGGGRQQNEYVHVRCAGESGLRDDWAVADL